jgi:hypothetical protein
MAWSHKPTFSSKNGKYIKKRVLLHGTEKRERIDIKAVHLGLIT